MGELPCRLPASREPVRRFSICFQRRRNQVCTSSLETCPYCGTEGILSTADGRCPHCKRLLPDLAERAEVKPVPARSQPGAESPFESQYGRLLPKDQFSCAHLAESSRPSPDRTVNETPNERASCHEPLGERHAERSALTAHADDPPVDAQCTRMRHNAHLLERAVAGLLAAPRGLDSHHCCYPRYGHARYAPAPRWLCRQIANGQYGSRGATANCNDGVLVPCRGLHGRILRGPSTKDPSESNRTPEPCFLPVYSAQALWPSLIT